MLTSLFSVYQDADIRTALLRDFAVLGKKNDTVITLVNNYASAQISLFHSTPKEVENEPLAEAIKTLGAFGNPSSFFILFSCLTADITPEITSLAKNSINAITTDYKTNIISLIKNNPPPEKLLAFRLAIGNSAISEFIHAEIAENALSVAINYTGADTQDIPQSIYDLQIESMRIIERTSWTRASSLVIRYFELAQKQHKDGKITDETFIEIINCLSVLASSDAGQTLSSYLGTLNSAMEKTDSYNEAVMLAVIKSLGVLGDKSAFDHLLYVTYLDYSDAVISAARDSLARLKW
jgi:hypothetical protein